MCLIKLTGNFRYMQYLSTITATLSLASLSTYSTWSSPSIPKLTSEDSPIGRPLTDEEASWVASAVLIAGFPGSLAMGYLVEKLGRRKLLLLAGIPLFVPWIVITFTKSLWLLIAVRFIGGMACATVSSANAVYVGEVAQKDIRGRLGSMLNVLKLTGSVFVLSIGPFVSYKALALCCSVIPLIFMVSFYFMPQSPYFLIKVGKRDAARANLIRLSAKNTDQKVIRNQLSEIETMVEDDMKNKATLWEFVSKPEYRKSIVIMFAIKTLQQFSGINAIYAYMQTILQESESTISPEISSIICGFIQIPAVFLAAGLVDRVGRKPLLVISALGCAAALIGEGTYFYFKEVIKTDLNHLGWLPTTGLVLYLLMSPIGMQTLPYVLLGELFAINIKGIAVATSTFYGTVLGFLVVKFFKPISNAWGMYTMFWSFAGVCILGSIFVVFVLPETKGKTFAEIQEMLKSNKRRQNQVRV